VHRIWNRPKSPLAGFNSNIIGKCDACFRAGFCSVNECSTQIAREKSIITRAVNKAKLTGFVDTSIMKKLMKKIMKNKKVNFKKYSKIVKKSIKKGLQSKNFRSNFKEISEALRLLASAKSGKDVKAALRSVEKALVKAKASDDVKRNIRKIAQGFNALVEKRKATGKTGGSSKIVRAAKKIKKVLDRETGKIQKYAQRIKGAKDRVKSVLETLKNKSQIKGKTKKNIVKLEGVLKTLREVLTTLKGTQNDINNTLATIKDAITEYSQ